MHRCYIFQCHRFISWRLSTMVNPYENSLVIRPLALGLNWIQLIPIELCFCYWWGFYSYISIRFFLYLKCLRMRVESESEFKVGGAIVKIKSMNSQIVFIEIYLRQWFSTNLLQWYVFEIWIANISILQRREFTQFWNFITKVPLVDPIWLACGL